MSAATLDSALTGSLPCVTCGYELKGLSIRGVCPECGTAVRATILYKVDPQAEEFKPIRHPHILAAGLVLWSIGGLVAAGACWFLRGLDLVSLWGGSGRAMPALVWTAVCATVISGIGSLALAHPMPGTRGGKVLQALVGTAAYVPLVWSMWRMLATMDPLRSAPYFAGPPQADRIVMRFIALASVVVILLGIRPNARDLVKRSMVLRTGRVDRQTLLGMAAVAAVTMVGEGIRLAAAGRQWGDPETLAVAGAVVIGIGSGMLTLGLIGSAVDSWRIAKAVLIPSPSLRQVVGG